MKGLILIPAFNAEETLEQVLIDVRKYCDLEILVVNDGSTDSTSEIALKNNCTLIEFPQNQGKGAAIQCGIDYAIKHKSDFLITFDSDRQHPADEIPHFIEIHKKHPNRILLGSRKRDRNMPGIRKFSNSVIAGMISFRIGKKLKDAQCGFRLIPSKYFDLEVTKLKGFVYEAEILIGWAENKIHLHEIPIPTIYFEQHKSKITYVDSTLIFLGIYFLSFFKSYKQDKK